MHSLLQQLMFVEDNDNDTEGLGNKEKLDYKTNLACKLPGEKKMFEREY